MSIAKTLRDNAGIFALAATVGLAGCATQRPDTSDIPAIHPRLKPQSCAAFEREASRLRPSRAGVAWGEWFGTGVNIITGNTRAAERSAERAARSSGRSAGDAMERSDLFENLKTRCQIDINALYAPGGVCATFTRQSSSVATQDNRVVGSSRGGINMQQECAAASIYAGPNLMVTPQQEVAPSNAPAAIPQVPGPAQGCTRINGRTFCPQ